MLFHYLCQLVLLTTLTKADVYFHVPRGSNNRLNENSAARDNANRLFDSQNNNRGGYNVGDKTDKAAKSEDDQYRMKYFMSDETADTVLRVEWTNQHGCGGNEDDNPQKQNCIMVLQYAYQEDVDDPTGDADTFRNGQNRNSLTYTKPKKLDETPEKAASRKKANIDKKKGLHESWDTYDKCYTRERNKGLFTADQELDKNALGYSSAIFTRQNAAGNKNGYECAEERDYYPYWHPTMWRDIAVMAENASMCSHYQSKSFNVQPYGECMENKGWSRWNTQSLCEENGGQWVVMHSYQEIASQHQDQASCESASTGDRQYVWAVPQGSTQNTPQCLLTLPPPDCLEAPWSRSNHLGNGANGQPNTYDWTLPYFPSGNTQRCVLRIRYNISTDDYDPYYTDSNMNQYENEQVKFPIQQNPYVDIGGRSPLRLAINTAQFGRVFQDRSHVFLLRARPEELQGQSIFNLNVRGKRGNIVQTYPAVEYDFAPNRLTLTEGDLVHVQWTGSNTHKNGNPAGDGQAGDTGEGKSGTDRSNMVEILSPNDNFPVPFEGSVMWGGAEVKWIYHGQTGIQPQDLAVDMASSGYYRCLRQADCQSLGADISELAVDKKGLNKMQDQLDNAPASYEGVVLKFTKGTYHYMCSRNNSFTNRSQKGTIVCK